MKVKRFLELYPGKLRSEVGLKEFLGRLHELPGKGDLSGNFAYRLVFVPEKGRGRVVITAIRRGHEVSMEYVTWGKRRVRISEAISIKSLKHLENHKVKAENKEYYPVLDLEDESLSGLPIKVRVIREKPLEGKKEAVVELPEEVYTNLRRDILYVHDTTGLIGAIGRALKGKEVKLNKFMTKILTMGVTALMKTDGIAIQSLHKMSDDEREVVLHAFDRHVKLSSTARRALFGGLRNLFREVEDVDDATKKFHSLLSSHGIRAPPEKVRKWIEMAKKAS